MSEFFKWIGQQEMNRIQIRILISDTRLPEKDIFVLSKENIKMWIGVFSLGRAEARGPAQASRLLTWPVILQQLPEQQITQHHTNTTSPYIHYRHHNSRPCPPQLMARSCKLV
jgi:hypothetical protein